MKNQTTTAAELPRLTQPASPRQLEEWFALATGDQLTVVTVAPVASVDPSEGSILIDAIGNSGTPDATGLRFIVVQRKSNRGPKELRGEVLRVYACEKVWGL